MAWSTHINTWELSWEIVSKVNRPNFGLLLDTFHIVAKTYVDPTIEGNVKPDGHEELRASMDRLVSGIIPPERVFFCQAADGERLEPHQLTGISMHPLMYWSRNCRLFPLEEGSFLPAVEVVAAFAKAGFSDTWMR
jgi:4-hydroxyphenylpyruvate dioxygenase